jgi:glycosyltransferase involved in cell wall biosynthesis
MVKVLLISIVPPKNDCGVRIVMHRHFVQQKPFELIVATNFSEDYEKDFEAHEVRPPAVLHFLRRSRFGPRLRGWLRDMENLVWPLYRPKSLLALIDRVKPDVILTLAETGLCHTAARLAEERNIPLAVLFLDWFPIMKGHYGSEWSRAILSRRYRALYQKADLAICTSDGMKEELGNHPNSHVVYPMPAPVSPPPNRKREPSQPFRLAYVGSVRGGYGRMLASLVVATDSRSELELVIAGPDADWSPDVIESAKNRNIYRGFVQPEEAAVILADADALLVVMSFDEDQELFMRTSFTTKFLDYVAFGKPVILWGPDYCSPMRVIAENGGALPVNSEEPQALIEALDHLRSDSKLQAKLSSEAAVLHRDRFSPSRLQDVLVSEIERLATLKVRD